MMLTLAMWLPAAGLCAGVVTAYAARVTWTCASIMTPLVILAQATALLAALQALKLLALPEPLRRASASESYNHTLSEQT